MEQRNYIARLGYHKCFSMKSEDQCIKQITFDLPSSLPSFACCCRWPTARRERTERRNSLSRPGRESRRECQECDRQKRKRPGLDEFDVDELFGRQTRGIENCETRRPDHGESLRGRLQD